MNHDIAKMRDDPLALRKTVHGERLDLMAFPQLFLELVDDRLEMRIAGAGADQEKVGEGRRTAQVDDNDVFRLFVSTNCGAGLGEALRVDGFENQGLG